MSLPRNPIDERAFNLDDLHLRRYNSFAVIKGGKLVMKGIFIDGSADYDSEEGGWPNIPVKIEDGTETEISPYETGIVCRPNGKWLPPDVFVIGMELEE
jgi:hypothetical protein